MRSVSMSLSLHSPRLLTMHIHIIIVVLLGLVTFISTSSCPEVINSTITYGSHGGDKELLGIYKILTSCSEVRALDLKISHGGGCIHSQDDPWNFKFSRGDTFPPLRSLKLKGYKFDDPKTMQWWRLDREIRNYLADISGVNTLRPYERPIEPPSASNLDQWRLAMDWKQLETLEVADVNLRFLQKIIGQLPSLKSLKFGIGWTNEWCQIANQTSLFLKESPPLTALSLHGYTTLMNWTDILPRHGNTLKKLEIHDWESAYHRPVLSVPQLQRIKSDCLLLEHFSIRVDRNGTWPYEVLDTLASFENLKKLELWLDLGVDLHQDEGPIMYRSMNDDSFSRQSRVNSSSALNLFNHLRTQKKALELQEMILYVGDWGRDYGGGMGMKGWGEGLEEKFRCSVLDSDDHRKPEGDTWCWEECDWADEDE